MPDPIQFLIDLALQEDIKSGDITTDALFGAEPIEKKGTLLAKQDLVVSGLDIAKRVFCTLDHHIEWKSLVHDGDFVHQGTLLAEVSGRFQSLLKAERTALNFLQHLSGVATLTHQVVSKIRGTSAKILDTRKTLPGYRVLEKKAVKDGGGVNHRQGLYDQFLIKDNHLAGRSITEAVKLAQDYRPGVFIELEVDRLDQIEEVIQSGADRVLLDNFSLDDLKKAVDLLKKLPRCIQTEASGGITIDNVLDYAKTGVDFISLGALTHSAPAADISLDI